MAKKTTILLIIFCSCSQLQATSVIASSFGFDPTDATDALKAAYLSNFDTIIIDKQSSDWNTRPIVLFDLEVKTFMYQPGVVVRAIPGQFTGTGDCLLRLVRCHQMNLIGYQATFAMNKPEYAVLNDSEYRHCLQIDNGVDISIYGLTFRDSGGDGIYVGGADWLQEPRTYSENILIEDVRCINNYRQGLSITSVQNMTVRYAQFSETQGTLPEAGVDVEPFETYQRIVNLQFEHCLFERNAWAGIAVALVYMDSTSLPVSIRFSDCTLRKNGSPDHPYGASEIFVSADDNKPVQGSLLFERCVVDSSEWSALYSRKTAAAYTTVFKDCVFNNISLMPNQYNEPIFLEVPSYNQPSKAIGGMHFDHVYLSYPTSFNFLRIFGWSTLEGIAAISGKITVVAPNGSGTWFQQVADTTNYTLQYEVLAALPPVNIELEKTEQNAQECQPDGHAKFRVLRTSSRLDYPLAVRYTQGGTAVIADDVHQLTGITVAPTDAAEQVTSIVARPDGINEDVETTIITPLPSTMYGTVPPPQSFNVYDCIENSGAQPERLPQVGIWPNPTTGYFVVEFNKYWDKILIFNILGEKIGQFNAFDELELNGRANGVYTLEFFHQGQNTGRARIILVNK